MAIADLRNIYFTLKTKSNFHHLDVLNVKILRILTDGEHTNSRMQVIFITQNDVVTPILL